MSLFFYVGVANPKYNQKHIQFALKEWDQDVFWKELQNKLEPFTRQNYLIRTIEDENNNTIIFRPEVKFFLLTNLVWYDLKYSFPTISLPFNDESHEQMITIAYDTDYQFYQKNANKLKLKLQKNKDKISLEQALYLFLTENNYKNFFIEEEKVFAFFDNSNEPREIQDDSLKYIIELYKTKNKTNS